MKTRRLRKKSSKKTRSRKQKVRVQAGAGESCYGKGKTWSCSAACGENGACQRYD
jgi:hypothetical protein